MFIILVAVVGLLHSSSLLEVVYQPKEDGRLALLAQSTLYKQERHPGTSSLEHQKIRNCV
jgi:hypothetical protein